MEDLLIVGGGVAGLSAANYLVDAGYKPIVIESCSYPGHRICGEYFSHEGLPFIQKWGIAMTSQVRRCRFIKDNLKMEFTLPIYAANCSRYDFDFQLLKRAENKGARILTDTKVEWIKPPEKGRNHYELQLQGGKTILCKQLMIGTGRIPNTSKQGTPPVMKYAGFKAHYGGIDLENCIEMHTFPGGYLGMVNIDDHQSNVACLVKKTHLMGCTSPDQFLDRLMKNNSSLRERLSQAKMLSPKWLAGELPEFGIRDNPEWEGTFWIGDAAGSIPPVSGEGLAIAITSGCMAAEYFLHSDAKKFHKAWLRRYKKRFFWAQQLHRVMSRPLLAGLALQFGKMFPAIPKWSWELTREKQYE